MCVCGKNVNKVENSMCWLSGPDVDVVMFEGNLYFSNLQHRHLLVYARNILSKATLLVT